MKNQGFIAFLIDSIISLLLGISLFMLFRNTYNQATNIMKIILLLGIICIIPICLSIIIASTSGKKTIGRRLVEKKKKVKKRNFKKS